MTTAAYRWYATAERDRIRLHKCKADIAGVATSETPEGAIELLQNWLAFRMFDCRTMDVGKLVIEAEEEEHGRPVDPGEVFG